VSFNDFTKDRMRSSAVIREFEVIGKAVGKLPAELKVEYADIQHKEWRDHEADNLGSLNADIDGVYL